MCSISLILFLTIGLIWYSERHSRTFLKHKNIFMDKKIHNFKFHHFFLSLATINTNTLLYVKRKFPTNGIHSEPITAMLIKCTFIWDSAVLVLSLSEYYYRYNDQSLLNHVLVIQSIIAMSLFKHLEVSSTSWTTFVCARFPLFTMTYLLLYLTQELCFVMYSWYYCFTTSYYTLQHKKALTFLSKIIIGINQICILYFDYFLFVSANLVKVCYFHQ